MKLTKFVGVSAAAVVLACAAKAQVRISPHDVQYRNGHAIWQGDIIVGSEEQFRSAALDPRGVTVGLASNLWPTVAGVAQVPYTVDTSAGPSFVTVIQNAITSFNTTLAGIIQFVPATSQANTILIGAQDAPLPSCSGVADIGMSGGQQNISLAGNGANCPVSVVLHEMGHAIGMYHEQVRSDRNNYLNVNFSAISRGSWTEYQQVQPSFDVGLYDFGSTMQYSRYLFVRDATVPAFETLPAGITVQQEGPYSAGDVDAIKRLYAAAPQQITITSNPPGAKVIVDGTTITTPQTYSWPIGSTHSLDVVAGIQTVNGITYLFSGADQGGVLGRWSDQAPGAPSAHTITVAAGDGFFPTRPQSAPAVTVYSAHFIELIPAPPLTANPAGSGTIQMSPAPFTVGGAPYVVANQPLTLTATPAAGYNFYDWYPSTRLLALGYGANPLSFRPSQGTLQLNPTFTQSPVTTITSNPPGRNVVVDNVNYTTPKNFAPPFDLAWNPSSTHTVNVATDPQFNQISGAQPYTIFAFNNWGDGGATSHTITVGPGVASYAANFTTQYGIVMGSWPSCQGSSAVTGPPMGPNGPYYNAGSTLSLSVSPNSGWTFTGWTGDTAGTAMTVTADGEKVLVPGFNLSSEPLAISNISPATVVIGGSDLSMTINGTGFVKGASLCINGQCSAVPATFVNGHQLTVTVPAASMKTPGNLFISVIQADPTSCSAQSSPVPLAVTAAASSSNSTAPPLSGNYKLVPQNATGLCLDVVGAGTAAGTAMDVWGCTGNSNQSFNLVSQGNGAYLLQPSNATNLCLDVWGAGTSPGTNVDVWNCTGNSNQLWTLISDGGNVYELAPQNAPGLRLDVVGAGTAPGAMVDVWTANGGSNQKWAVTK